MFSNALACSIQKHGTSKMNKSVCITLSNPDLLELGSTIHVVPAELLVLTRCHLTIILDDLADKFILVGIVVPDAKLDKLR